MRNVIVISDLHCGCRLGLCHEGGIALDDGGRYEPSVLQRKVWGWWREVWDQWVPSVTRKEAFAVVVNGDALDGVHHGSTTQISQNLGDQAKIALSVLEPIRDACRGRLYVVRGTEAHAGKSAVDEETLARALGAIPNEAGQHARWDLWMEIGGRLLHFLHHIGFTGSNAYEATAVGKELVEEYNEAARWSRRRPDCIIRSHRHRHIEVRVPTDAGFATAFVTAGWQLKTPFVWRIPGGRLATPQIGAHLIRAGDEDLYTRHKIFTIDRSATENYEREDHGRRMDRWSECGDEAD
jgi:hypothetical protein